MTNAQAAEQPAEPLWERPVPTIGDASSAAHRAGRLNGWAFPADAQQALREIIGARRDVRRFRPDPVPDDLVRFVIESAHMGPSVGHSQPWRFIVVTDPALRERAALMADRERITQAEGMTSTRGAQLLDLKVEGIREAPLGVVVACDRRAPASGVLGRATFPDADLWSCAAAIENMWLTARGAGLGVGWVTLFEPEQLAELVGLPEGVETLGWLCVGWPDELPPSPGLERRAWSTKLPLDDLVMENRWATEGPPQTPPSYVRAPDQRAGVRAYDETDLLLTTPGSLGVLDAAAHKVAAAGRSDYDTATVVMASADHPVHELGVSAFPDSVTRVVAEAGTVGKAVGAAMAAANGFGSIVVDCGVGRSPGAAPVLGADRVHRPGRERGDILHADALHPADVDMLAEAGRALGTELAETGLTLLGEVGLGNTTIAAALAAAALGIPAAQAVGLGTASDAAMVERKAEVVAGALARIGLAEGERAPASMSSRELLGHLGGGEFAYLYGLVLGAAESRGVVVLDGLAGSVPALLAVREEPGVAAYLVAGQVSREVAHRAVLRELGLEPLVDLRIRAGEGVGAILGAGMILSALAVRRNSGRTGE